jgi:hydrogenase maturation protease
MTAPLLLLALGNDILSDDGVAFLAARALREQFDFPSLEIIESGEAGLALLEFLEGRERVLILDSALTGRATPGTVLEFSPQDFRNVVAPSPHYAGLPEVLELGRRLGVVMPQEIRVVALEVEDPFTIREELTPAVRAALPQFIARAAEVLAGWTRQAPTALSEPALP